MNQRTTSSELGRAHNFLANAFGPLARTIVGILLFIGICISMSCEPTSSSANPFDPNSGQLDYLTTNRGLWPPFAPDVYDYEVSVSYETSQIVFQAKSKVNSTTTLNGGAIDANPQFGGTPIRYYRDLNVGVNTFTIANGYNGGTKTYTIKVTRNVPSSNANLTALTLSSGSLSPAFSPDSIVYSATVAATVSSITITPTLADTTARVSVNTIAIDSANPSAAINLAGGSNAITIKVTAQNGTTKTYALSVSRATTSNLNLAALAISSGTLAPAFSAQTTAYTATVPYEVSSVTTTAQLMDANTTLKINGATATSATASAPIALAVGPNSITVEVKQTEGSSSKNYTITITRAPSANTALKALTISSGSLEPPFDSSKTSYAVSVSGATSSIQLTATLADVNATLKINNLQTTSAVASSPISLAMGTNTIPVVVTAQNGTSSRSYSIIVTRVGSANATLASLTNGGAETLSPAFDSATLSYTMELSYQSENPWLRPVTADGFATVSINGYAFDPNLQSSGIVPCPVGITPIAVVVTAQNGTTTKTYTITVTRRANIAPGTISFTNASQTGASLSWTAATGGFGTITYQGYYSTQPNINSLSDIEAHGTPVGAYQSATTASLSGLTAGNAYYFNVLAKDGNGIIAPYPMIKCINAGGLGAAYHLDNNLVDSSGSANTALAVGASIFAASGKKGYGISGPSTANFIYLPGGKYNLAGDYTVAMWVKTTSAGGWLISKQGVAGNDGHGYRYELKMWVNTAGNVQCELGSTTAWSYGGVISTQTINDGNWHFVCLVISGTTVKVFIDTNPATSATSTLPRYANTSSAIALGANSASNSSTLSAVSGSGLFSGTMDEIYLYSRALTDGEVETLYTTSQ